ncbi:DUF7079 family protein [Azospirillum agricola]|uniref:DUF7079 family protein n=1 Tax=Azospirillum agricola TaxID=1720247 RepID=UPI000A0EFA5F|nr:hypothetical protein [Azospirillum agricola]SMH48085.1 hypothetical protein SAMN02982994_2740 [Azospirillum lipoferum]
MMGAAEVERRMPVWLALAELFLDTELDAADHDRIRAVLAASGYAEAVLHDILRREVAPAFGPNLFAVAGIWDGWDEADARRLLHPVIAGGGFGWTGWLTWRLLRRDLEADWARVNPFAGPPAGR